MQTSCDVLIVGGGLFGSIIYDRLTFDGHYCLLMDSDEKNAGSKPAACLMKPSWFSSLGKEIYKPALETLDKLYGVEDIKFKIGIASANVHWCNPNKILNKIKLKGKVYSFKQNPDEDHWTVSYYRNRECFEMTCKKLIFATGYWTKDLFENFEIKGLAGLAFLLPDFKIETPFIKPWAPYRQLVGFNRGDGAWFGDGTAIKVENWQEQRNQQVEKRCLSSIDQNQTTVPLFGIRPYCKMSPCYLKEEFTNLWIATGGAKNGTLAAGWAANELARRFS